MKRTRYDRVIGGAARFRAATGAATGVLVLLGCYEAPPRLPPDYHSQPPPRGWPPAAVYVEDRFHPANRWFHRAFSARDAGGQPLAAPSDVADSPLAEPTAVDRAELLALLAALLEEGLPAASEPLSGALLRADLLRASDVWQQRGEAELAKAHRAAAQALREK